MLTRLLFVLLLLAAPAAALATPACCADEAPAQGCAPDGDCPTDVGGNCTMPELLRPPSAALAGATDAIAPAMCPAHPVPDGAATLARALVTHDAAAPAYPPHLRFQSLRN